MKYFKIAMYEDGKLLASYQGETVFKTINELIKFYEKFWPDEVKEKLEGLSK